MRLKATAIIIGLALSAHSLSSAAAVSPNDSMAARLALSQWARTRTSDSLAAHLALYRDTLSVDGRQVTAESMRRRFEWELTGPMVSDVSRATVVAAGDSVVADSVLSANDRATSILRLVFGRSDGEWRVRSLSTTGSGPIEMGLPGIGSGYVDMIEAWSQTNLAWVEATLLAHRPDDGDPGLRAQALFMLDEPLHLRSSHHLESVRGFLRRSIDRAIDEIRSEQVTEGATIWKLYNHGWVVKTPNHCWAHDFYEGVERASMSDEQIDALLGEVEALFCSHWHRDHTSTRVVQRALAKGLPVCLPPLPPGGWGAHIRESVPDLANATIAVRGADGGIAGLRYHAYPGHQRELENDLFAVTADGITVLHSGDQVSDADYEWIDRIADDRTIDVFLGNVWIDDFPRFMRGVRPRWVLPGHENELGHGFDGRAPYDMAYDRTRPVRDANWRVLAWGERVHIDPR